MQNKIQIQKDILEFAFENHSFDTQYYLDIETGNIITKSEGEFIEEDFETEEIEEEELEENSDRFCCIDPIESRRSFEIMENFIETITDKKIKDDLINAINRKKPFRNFKDRLYNYPEIQDRWYKFYGEELEKIMLEWLQDNNIIAELI